MFKIDRTQLIESANTDQVCNALYAAVYTEFVGASTNPLYSHLSNLDRMNKVNEFANKWLEERGLN